MNSLIERLLSRDINVKILAALLAFSLWLYVASEENPEATQIVPAIDVVPRNVPEDLAVVSMDPSPRVSVTVRSRPSVLADFDPDSVQATVDLAEVTAGIHARIVRVQVPEGIHVVSVEPSELVVALETMMARELDVEVSLEGNPQPGVDIGEPLVFPSVVRLTGAATKVEAVHRVVSGIDVEDMQDNMVFEGVQVFAVDAAGRQVSGVSVSPETVRIIVPVESRPAQADEDDEDDADEDVPAAGPGEDGDSTG